MPLQTLERRKSLECKGSTRTNSSESEIRGIQVICQNPCRRHDLPISVTPIDIAQVKSSVPILQSCTLPESARSTSGYSK